MNQKIENPKVEVPEGIEMNDRDYLNVLLELEKDISNNISIALNEASNDSLYEHFFNILESSKNMGRELYNLMFKMGWYSLEASEQQKIQTKYSELKNKNNQLNSL